jgi:hypothetical protein
MSSDPHRRARRAIDAHFAGASTPAREQAMRAHLPECAPCHDHYERRLLLARLDPAGVPAEARLARGLGLPAPGAARRSAGWGLGGLLGAAMAAACLLFWVAPGRRAANPIASSSAPSAPFPAAGGDYATRGGPPLPDAARLPQVMIFRIARAGGVATPSSAADRVSARDELAFAYRNPGGKGRLLVFAVDEHRHVFWYHPEWSRAGEDPVGIPISVAPGLHELPAAVAQPFDGERLVIHALFTDRDLTVRQVEAALAVGGPAGPAGQLLFPGTIDVVRWLRVAR